MIRVMHEKNSEMDIKANASESANSCAAADIEAGAMDFAALAQNIKRWGQALGFAEIGIASAEVSAATPSLMHWLALGRHGEMDYMAKHAALRANPQALVAGTVSVIAARLPYWPEAADGVQTLANAELGYISRYALGRDYHKTIRNRLQKLADRIHAEIQAQGRAALAEAFVYRVFSDSAPVMEVEFARQSGIAWHGKHTLSLSKTGSWHFLGEIYTSLPLPPDEPIAEHCGDCHRCLDACPTAAIVAPYEVDARRCISYLTIELHGTIPVELRPLIGNRIYGCDDCQLCCPWNKFAQIGDPDFAVRHQLDATPLTTLFAWSATEFEARLAGSPLRRIGHERWLRNIAVALGNALRASPQNPEIINALAAQRTHASTLVREHVLWALDQGN
jgi:epoxyqueuosine reductase